MFKKIITIIFVLVNGFIFASCGFNKNGDMKSETEISQVEINDDSQNDNKNETNDQSSNHEYLSQDLQGKYQISSYEDLQKFNDNQSDYSDKDIILMNDIEFKDSDYWTPIESFSGTFDGNNHSITNLKIKTSNSILYDSNFGFFQRIDQRAEVKNLSFISPTITITINKDNINATCGVVAGTCDSGTLSNVMVIGGNVKCEGYGNIWTGALVGFSRNYSTFYRCYNSAIIKSITYDFMDDAYCGGIVGGTDLSTIEQCINYGDIFAGSDNATHVYAGGIIGLANNCLVQYCQNNGKIDAKANQQSLNYAVFLDDCMTFTNNNPETGKWIDGNDGGYGKNTPSGLYAVKWDHNAKGGGQYNGTQNGKIEENRLFTYFHASIGGICGKCENKTKISDCTNNGTLISDYCDRKYKINITYKLKHAGKNVFSCVTKIENEILFTYGSSCGNIAGDITDSELSNCYGNVNYLKEQNNKTIPTKIEGKIRQTVYNYSGYEQSDSGEATLGEFSKSEYYAVRGGKNDYHGICVGVKFDLVTKFWAEVFTASWKYWGKTKVLWGEDLQCWDSRDKSLMAELNEEKYPVMTFAEVDLTELEGIDKSFDLTPNNLQSGGLPNKLNSDEWMTDTKINNGYPTLKWAYWQNIIK
mgnify:CR=1 FL=1